MDKYVLIYGAMFAATLLALLLVYVLMSED